MFLVSLFSHYLLILLYAYIDMPVFFLYLCSTVAHCLIKPNMVIFSVSTKSYTDMRHTKQLPPPGHTGIFHVLNMKCALLLFLLLLLLWFVSFYFFQSKTGQIVKPINYADASMIVVTILRTNNVFTETCFVCALLVFALDPVHQPCTEARSLAYFLQRKFSHENMFHLLFSQKYTNTHTQEM